MRRDGFDTLGKELATGKSRRQFLKALGAGAAAGLLAPFRRGSAQGDTRSPNNAERSAVFVQGMGIPNSSNSITAVVGDIRPDPEGIAPPRRVTLITWKDSRDAERAMTLGAYLYQYDFSFDDGQQIITRSANDNAYGHPGFGYVVSHNTETGNSPLGKANAPSNVESIVFSGGHHAIHRVEFIYDREKEPDGFGIQIPVVIEWFVATGRDHPVWAVTWKMDDAANPQNRSFDEYRMDVRGPYGSLNFDGAATPDQGDAIGGVAWGDFGLKFTTTDAQLTLNSPWTYTTPNTVCFTQSWTANENAEMGIVQTRVADKEMGYQDRVVGRERGHISAENYLNKGDCTDFGGDNRTYAVPCVSGWPYQLMNFDWDPTAGKPVDEPTGTKLIAWGSPYGWLGASSFDLFDYSATADGRGDRSYATFIVLGPKLRQGNDQAGDVALTIKAVEALNAAMISDVNPGSLVTQVAKGPGATQLKNLTNGYNDSYTAYYVNANDNQVAFTFTPAAGTVVNNPIFVVQNYTIQQLPNITVDGNPSTINVGADAGAFVSLNPATHELWVTINAAIHTATRIEIGSGTPDTIPPVITLLGDNPLTITVGTDYNDPGATATDNIDGDLTDSIVVGGDTVNPNIAGDYIVTYNIEDSSSNAAVQKTRTVHVVSTSTPDTTPPVITVVGSNPLTIEVGSVYTDPGATALDNKDGNLTAAIVVGGDTVNPNAVGTYVVTYNVKDSSGNAAVQKTRIVIVSPVTNPIGGGKILLPFVNNN